MSSTPTPHKFETLDGMRGIAALAVVLYHLTQHTGFPLFKHAFLAVDMFFILSGFVIAHSYSHRLTHSMSWWNYTKRRLIRLYPMFMIGLAIGGAALTLKSLQGLTTIPLESLATAFVLNAFYLPYLNPFATQIGGDSVPGEIFPFNGPAWSLFFELIANLAFIASLYLSRRSLILSVAATGIFLGVSILATQGLGGWGASNILSGLPRVMFGFFSGVLFYSYLPHILKYTPRLHPYTIYSLMILLFICPIWSPLYMAVGVLGLMPLCVMLGIKSSINRPHNKPSEVLGYISYPLYCIHFPILHLVESIAVQGHTSPYIISGAALVMALGLTIPLAKYVEEPCRNYLSTKFIK